MAKILTIRLYKKDLLDSVSLSVTKATYNRLKAFILECHYDQIGGRVEIFNPEGELIFKATADEIRQDFSTYISVIE